MRAKKSKKIQTDQNRIPVDNKNKYFRVKKSVDFRWMCSSVYLEIIINNIRL